MLRRIKRQEGLSLVEVTIMLLVLMLLTSVLAPSIWDFVHDAQWVKVKEDCEAIGISFSRLVRDIGPCLRVNATSLCTTDTRVDVLYSDGVLPSVMAPAIVGLPILTTNWLGIAPYGAALSAANMDRMENQFVLNTPAYKTPLEKYIGTYPVGPLFGIGWRGAYLSSPIGPDPWGGMYQVNSGFFTVATDVSGTGPYYEGAFGRWWERDVVCLSPGPDGAIQTSFAPVVGGYTFVNYGTWRLGDDYVFVVSGSGR